MRAIITFLVGHHFLGQCKQNCVTPGLSIEVCVREKANLVLLKRISHM
jgi:hypothetical protein